jgi:uncharacterized membrane protein YedE/YeeE
MGEFTPVSAAIGGALIGLAATLLMLLTGRIAGIAGIFAGIVPPAGAANDRGWRIAFIAGLILAPLVAGLAGYPMAPTQLPGGPGLIAGAGLLVGLGTRLAGGCTSGHGICGLARVSARSMVATAVFVATAMAVVAIARHVLGG